MPPSKRQRGENAVQEAGPPASSTPKSPAQEVYGILEIRRRILKELDRRTLAVMLRTEKAITASVAEVLYRKIHISLVSKMSKASVSSGFNVSMSAGKVGPGQVSAVQADPSGKTDGLLSSGPDPRRKPSTGLRGNGGQTSITECLSVSRPIRPGEGLQAALRLAEEIPSAPPGRLPSSSERWGRCVYRASSGRHDPYRPGKAGDMSHIL